MILSSSSLPRQLFVATRHIRYSSTPLHFSSPSSIQSYTAHRKMATVKDSIPHIIRTAEDPRQRGIWSARLSKIDQVNPKIRLLRLSLPRDGVCVLHYFMNRCSPFYFTLCLLQYAMAILDLPRVSYLASPNIHVIYPTSIVVSCGLDEMKYNSPNTHRGHLC